MMWLTQSISTYQNIATLRNGGGSSAYVPTTSIMSLTDNFLPQVGGSAASGFIEDARGVGVTNAFIQEICALQPGGISYLHEGVMFSNLAYDLAIDALTHDGPGEVARLDLRKNCRFLANDGLSVTEVVQTELETNQGL